ncbi:MAG: hypothetical protein DRI74_08965 [Bacteroidetes bacterium]|nr:MAG: hypothetical protein DRI74_08965 [Bacteroidota bacterium]
MNYYPLNAGSLSDLGDIYLLDDEYTNEFQPSIGEIDNSKLALDFRYLEKGRINTYTLTSLISYFSKISSNLGYPVPLILDWNPYILKFLERIDFFKTISDFNIFWYDDRFLGGYGPYEFNPNTKIFGYSKLTANIEYNSDLLDESKERLRRYFEDDLGGKISNLFSIKDSKIISDLDELIRTLSIVSAELIVNSLIHGKSSTFVGLQRSPRRISISICDSGLGFENTLPFSHPWINNLKLSGNSQYIGYACFIKESGFGIKQAIEKILNIHGRIHISSNTNELVLKPRFWSNIKERFAKNKANNFKQDSLRIISNEFPSVPSQYRTTGYCRYFKSLYSQPNEPEKRINVEGTRISFEIPINYKE